MKKTRNKYATVTNIPKSTKQEVFFLGGALILNQLMSCERNYEKDWKASIDCKKRRKPQGNSRWGDGNGQFISHSISINVNFLVGLLFWSFILRSFNIIQYRSVFQWPSEFVFDFEFRWCNDILHLRGEGGWIWSIIFSYCCLTSEFGMPAL